MLKWLSFEPLAIYFHGCVVVCGLICIVSMYVGAFVMILFDDALCLFKLVE